MSFSPDFASFKKAFDAKQPVLMHHVLVADLETPVSTMLKIGADEPFRFLLESVEGGATRGRYSVIGLRPDLIWRCFGDKAEINRQAEHDRQDFTPCPEPSLASLRQLLGECRLEIPPGLPPMASGLFGYMGYDTVRLIERLPDKNPDELGLPDALLMRPTVIAVFDNVADAVILASPVWPGSAVDAQTAYDRAVARLTRVIEDFDRPLPERTVRARPEAAGKKNYGEEGGEEGSKESGEEIFTSNTGRDAYHWMVERAKEYIRAGDIFQVVPSQRFSAPFHLPSFALYRALRRLNPSPFLYFFDFAEFAVVGSSPEILVRLRDQTMTIRPIAGTRPRGGDASEDTRLAEDLLADPKELAEHLMLLDLGRNDVGRVAEIGSVHVTEKMAIERYSHVMHIVSNVEGRIAPGRDGLDALMAGFPAGTVSGAPKVRAMEIIDELEMSRRGLYGGAVGYFGADGSIDFCIALRTALIHDHSIYVQAGGGVVADSDPEAEYQESRNKARALLRAAKEAERYAPPSQ